MSETTYKRVRFILWLPVAIVILPAAALLAIVASENLDEFKRMIGQYIPEWPRRVLKDFPF